MKLKKIRKLIAFFICVLFVSGLTAIPIDMELSLLLKTIPTSSFIYKWIQKILAGYRDTKSKYPFFLYGFDWLAFAHFILAILFLGPYKTPVKNIWVIEFGMIACILIIPFAFIAGYFRQIPIGWRLIDCSFGVFGLVTLRIIYKEIKKFGDESKK